MSEAGKKTPRRTVRKIKQLHPDRGDANWPIRGEVELYKHSATRSGYNVSREGRRYFKCRLKDISGMIDAVAYGEHLADSYVEHFKQDKVVLIRKAELRPCNMDYQHINNHLFEIRLKKDTQWEYGRKPRRTKSTDSCLTCRRRTRSMERIPNEPSCTESVASSTMVTSDGLKMRDATLTKIPNMNQNSSNGMYGDVKEEKGKGSLSRDMVMLFKKLSRRLIDNEWEFFFRELMDEADHYINEVKIDHQNKVREQIYTLLYDWFGREKDASLERIITALRECERNDLIELIKKELPHRMTDGVVKKE